MLEGLHITPEVLRLIAEIDEFKGRWRALKILAPERLDALRRVATIASIGSSTRIEGAKLSDREVEMLLTGVKSESFVSRDEEEVAGYAEAMEHVFAAWESIPLTENYIKQLHQILLQHSSKNERHRGQYKTLDNRVQATDEDGQVLGIVFETASPFDTPHLMEEVTVETQTALEEDTLHPLIVIGAFIVRFLAIHPFQDGNGRLSRILTTLLLLRTGYAYVPYSSLESIIEENKESYYLALRRTQTTLNSDKPDWKPWLIFFLRALHKQVERLGTKMEREHLIAGALPPLSGKIIELVRAHGRIATGEIETLTGESRSTIKVRLGELVKAGHLLRHGKGRSTWYSLGRGGHVSEGESR
jgi:Fic family protein